MALGTRFAEVLRRAVVALGAAMLLVMPHLAPSASFGEAMGGAGPVAALLVGLAFWMMPILLVASWVAAGRARLRVAWLAIPVGLFIVGAAVSTLAACDKSAAMVRAAQLAGVWAAFFALVQAIRSGAERRMLLAALVAAALVSAIVAIHQGTVGYAQAWEYFQAHREEVLAERGIEPGSWLEQMFIARFTGGVQAAMGHPNVLASMLLLAILVAAGMVREKWSPAAAGARVLAVCVAAAALVLAVALVMTQSRGGLAAALVGAYLLAVTWWVRRRSWRIALWVLPFAVAAVGLAAATQMDQPAVQNALLTLRYRLDYWRGTWPVLVSHGLAGVGLENFGHHYLEHKLATAPEEVRDPHNMWLSAWSQMGLAGLAAAVSLAVGAAWHWVRGSRRAGTKKGTGTFSAKTASAAPKTPMAPKRSPSPFSSPDESILVHLLPALAVAVPVIAYLSIVANPLAPLWLSVAALGLMMLVLGLAAGEDVERLMVPGRPLEGLRAACIVAVAAFLVHEQIGTALAAPATAWALLVVLGVSLEPAARDDGAGGGPGRAAAQNAGAGRRDGAAAPVAGPAPGRALPVAARSLLMLLAMGFAFGYVKLLLIPVGQEATLLRAAEQGADPEQQDPLLAGAERVNRWDPEPAARRGRLWQRAAMGSSGPAAALALERAVQGYEAALQRNPRLRSAYLRLAECRLALPGALEDRAALEAARPYLAEAARLYPTHIETRLRLADVLDRLEDDAAALQEYRRVLDLDAAMPDEHRRLKAAERAAVERRVRELEDAAERPRPAEPPAAAP